MQKAKMEKYVKYFEPALKNFIMGMVLALIIELNLLSMGMYLPSSEFWMRNATETITLSYAMVLIFAAAFIFLNTRVKRKLKKNYQTVLLISYMNYQEILI